MLGTFASFLKTGSVVIVPPTNPPTEPPVSTGTAKVFTFKGQSNMAGYGLASELPSYLQGPLAFARVFSKARHQLEQLEAGYNAGSERSDPSHGPIITAMKELANYFGEVVYCIIYARNGSSLASASNDDWAPDGELRQPAKDLIAEGIAAIAAETGKPVEVLGDFWMQGETDAQVSKRADAYYANHLNIISDFKAEFNIPVFVHGRINGSLTTSLFPYTGPVRAAQVQIADDYNWIGWVDTDDLEKREEDNLHFTSAGQQILGRRMAQEYIRIRELLAA